MKICDFGLARDIYKNPDYVRKGDVSRFVVYLAHLYPVILSRRPEPLVNIHTSSAVGPESRHVLSVKTSSPDGLCSRQPLRGAPKGRRPLVLSIPPSWPGPCPLGSAARDGQPERCSVGPRWDRTGTSLGLPWEFSEPRERTAWTLPSDKPTDGFSRCIALRKGWGGGGAEERYLAGEETALQPCLPCPAARPARAGCSSPLGFGRRVVFRFCGDLLRPLFSGPHPEGWSPRLGLAHYSAVEVLRLQ